MMVFGGLGAWVPVADASQQAALARNSAKNLDQSSTEDFGRSPAGLPCGPESEAAEAPGSDLTLPFCADWDPDFSARGGLCCPLTSARGRGKGSGRCSPGRAKASYCDERTPEQIKYEEEATSGQLGDLLAAVTVDLADRSAPEQQARCDVNHGFLAWGRPVVPTSVNRIRLRTPTRCVNFGTDPMVGMIEWAGRQVANHYSAPEYSGLRMLVGDVAAPKGGCLSGAGGRKGHASHTSGQDADIGFLTPRPNRPSPEGFHTDFNAQANWWLIREFFDNPFACVKVVFLDRRMISKLARVASRDPEWAQLRRFIRHVPGHRNHFHVRIGEGPGKPGCSSGSVPELEPEDVDLAEDAEEELSLLKQGVASPEASRMPAAQSP